MIKSSKFQLVLIFLVTFLAYSNIFTNQFVGDDLTFIVNWDIPKNFSNLPQMLTNQSVPEGHEGGYRPVRTVVMAILYQLFGLNPLGYHVYSILVHLISTVLVYRISDIVYRNIKNDKRQTINDPQILPFITALLFGVHPIHTENITFILGSIDATSFLFYLASFYLFLKFKFGNSLALFGSMILGFLAYLTNELAVTLPILIIFYEFCFAKKRSTLLKKNLRVFLGYILILLMYFFIRMGFLNILVRGTYLENSFYLTMLTMAKAFLKYITLMIWPTSLSVNQVISPGIQTLINFYTVRYNSQFISNQTIFDPDILLSLLVILSLIFIAIVALKKSPVVTFAIGMFFICLLPVSFLLPQGNILQERYAYLASYGYVLLLGYSVQLTAYRLKKHSILILASCLVLLVSFYSYQTFNRNKDWENPVAMAESLAKQLPNDIPTLISLASWYEKEGEYNRAIDTYNKILVINPTFEEIYIKRELLKKEMERK